MIPTPGRLGRIHRSGAGFHKLLTSVRPGAVTIVTTAGWTHPRRVHGACGNIAPFSRAIRVALAAHRQRHLSAQDDVRGFRSVRVIWIRCLRPILPHVRVPEAFLLETSRELPLVHSIILANRRRFRRIPAPENGYALPAELGTPQKGRFRLQERRPLKPTRSDTRTRRRRRIGGRTCWRSTVKSVPMTTRATRPAFLHRVI